MSTLRLYTKAVDGTIPVAALLYDDEDILASQDNVGIYNGNQKSPQHQSGTVHATSHRLFYIDNAHPGSRSFALDFNHVNRTDYYAGLLRSSPKVTLHLNTPLPNQPALNSAKLGRDSSQDQDLETWECGVCSYRNPPGLSPAASRICSLCGVPRASVPEAKPASAIAKKVQAMSLSSSLPSSSAHLPSLASSAPASRSSPAPAAEVACPACTFLNHPAMPSCEICGTALPRAPARHAPAKSAPSSRPASDDEDDEEDQVDDVGPRSIKLSFRKGGDKAFYAVLRRSLLGKAWELRKGTMSPPSKNTTGSSGGRSGINSILHEVSSKATASQSNLEDALQDLEALMVKAREMVRHAEDLNARLTAVTAASALNAPNGTNPSNVIEPEEATFIRSSLAQLGLKMENAPVTQDMIKDERKWYEELARELAGVLQGRGGQADDSGIMKTRGIVALDEVWGGWNRARGVALIPPSTFLLVLPHLPVWTSPPIHVRTFPSGLTVLHAPPFTKAAFSSRLVSMLASGPRTTVELAYEEQLPIGLTQDMVLEVEEAGDICRDDGGAGVNILDGTQGGETRWWTNVFKGYSWDGEPSPESSTDTLTM